MYEPKWDGFRCLAFREGAAETPATYLVFDLLVDGDGEHVAEPLERRRERLPSAGLVRLSPATREREIAARWMCELGAGGLDGVVAKRLGAPYRSGERTAMQKVKRLRTADCVVGGFRYAQGSRIGPPGFTGDAPGGPSRWSTERSSEWQPLDATLVCEGRYDHFSGGRFRHGTKLLRWRSDKAPTQCTYAQLGPPGDVASLTEKAG